MTQEERAQEEPLGEIKILQKQIAELETVDTERKKSEHDLVASETRYRRLFESAQDGILILNAETGMIDDVNPFLIQMLGYSHKEFLGKKLWEVGAFKDAKKCEAAFCELQKEKYVRYEDMPLETAGGRLIDVEFVSNVYRVDNQRVIQCNIRDITERKQMTKALAQAKEDQFRTLIESLPQKIFLKDTNSVYISCNTNYASDLKIKPEEVVGRTDYDFFPTQLAEKYRDDDRRIIESGKTESREEEYHVIGDYLAGSEKAVINIVRAPVRDNEGKIKGIFGLFWDITVQKTLEKERNRVEALASAAEIKSRFATMVSHELRSPIAIIKEALDVVLDGLTGEINDEQQDVLETAKRNIDRLGRLIKNVLDFQKIEAGKMGYDFLENDINEVVREVHKSMSVLSRRKNLELHLELGDGLSRGRFDRDKIIQVLMNLMSNAIKNTSSGSVTISTQKENGTAHIRIRDTGKGIPAEDLHKLFIPFEKMAHMSEQEKGGTGLGLAISKELVLAHQGKIWAESEAGSGTTLHFTLPL